MAGASAAAWAGTTWLLLESAAQQLEPVAAAAAVEWAAALEC